MNLTSHGKRDFADVIKDFEMRDYPGLPSRPNHKGPYEREAGESKPEIVIDEGSREGDWQMPQC